MFAVTTKQENEFEIVVLQDTATGTSVEIIPVCGAVLHAFNINYQNEILNIIDNYKDKKDFDDQVENKGFKSCKLSPFACRLKNGNYHFGEKEYKIEKFYLGKHALHGLIYDAVYDIIKLDADETGARIELLYAYKGTDKGFPFKYDCRVVYELIKDNKLTIATIIKNNESYAIPMVDGWHPYFTFGGTVNDLYMQIATNEMLELDEQLIPTKKQLPYNRFSNMEQIGTANIDDCLLVSPSLDTPVLTLKDEVKKLQLEIFPDKSYPILQVYIPDNRQSIAVENLSGPPDAFNNQIHLNIIPAGKELLFATSFKISNTN